MKLKFSPNFSDIFLFSVFILLALTLARVNNLIIFGDLSEIKASADFLGNFLFRGLRFDLKYLATLLLIFFWLPAITLSWFIPDRRYSAYIHGISLIIICITLYLVFVDVGYILYFQKPIDVLIFGLFEDDTNAIISTIADNLSIIFLFIGFIFTAWLSIRLFNKQRQRNQSLKKNDINTTKQVLIWTISFVLLFILARGSLGSFPLQRKHASVSDNTFLNSLVMNSPFNLYYAFRDKSVNNRAIFKKDILRANNFKNSAQLIASAGYSETNPVKRTTAVNQHLSASRPHVIFVLMEGWSSHVALGQSENNNVLGEFARHAEADHYYTRFLANQYATNPSIEALLVNSPITPLSQSIANTTRFRLSNVLPFKQQAYQTLFLSGGYSSWRNHNNFWLAQGFDEYKGRSEIENVFNVDASDNPWGVYDQYLFEYLKKSLLQAEDEGQSLFSFVLTTNNHPPVRLPDDYIRPKLKPSVYGFDDDNEEKLSMLSGFHYQSDQLGRFISWIKHSPLKDKVIIVATGDHPLRTFIDNTAITDKYLRYSVPAYFYLPPALDVLNSVPADITGSHSDLFPTLFEVSLTNSSYYNFGQPLMEKELSLSYGWASHGEFIFAEGIVDSRNKKLYRWATAESEDNDGITESYYLKTETEAATTSQLKMIEQERYRRLLKQYFLVEDYQQQQ